jgi:hypothetical protein
MKRMRSLNVMAIEAVSKGKTMNEVLKDASEINEDAYLSSREKMRALLCSTTSADCPFFKESFDCRYDLTLSEMKELCHDISNGAGFGYRLSLDRLTLTRECHLNLILGKPPKPEAVVFTFGAKVPGESFFILDPQDIRIPNESVHFLNCLIKRLTTNPEFNAEMEKHEGRTNFFSKNITRYVLANKDEIYKEDNISHPHLKNISDMRYAYHWLIGLIRCCVRNKIEMARLSLYRNDRLITYVDVRTYLMKLVPEDRKAKKQRTKLMRYSRFDLLQDETVKNAFYEGHRYLAFVDTATGNVYPPGGIIQQNESTISFILDGVQPEAGDTCLVCFCNLRKSQIPWQWYTIFYDGDNGPRSMIKKLFTQIWKDDLKDAFREHRNCNDKSHEECFENPFHLIVVTSEGVEYKIYNSTGFRVLSEVLFSALPFPHYTKFTVYESSSIYKDEGDIFEIYSGTFIL